MVEGGLDEEEERKKGGVKRRGKREGYLTRSIDYCIIPRARRQLNHEHEAFFVYIRAECHLLRSCCPSEHMRSSLSPPWAERL